MHTLIISLLVIVALLASIARSARRTARLARRVPCGACGAPVLPAARLCPNCGSRLPRRGAAGMHDRLWQQPPRRLRSAAIYANDNGG